MITGITTIDRRAAVLQTDLSNGAATGRIITDCSAALGTPTCLVNDASLFQYGVAASFSYASLDTHMRTDVTVPLLLSRELYHALTTNGAEHRGVIINLLDQKLDNLNPDFLSYALLKAALSTITMQPAQALAPALRVVGVAPGITMVSSDQSQGGFTFTHQMTPLGQSSASEDIVGAMCYLTAVRTATGTTLFVDRGRHLMPLTHDVMFLTEWATPPPDAPVPSLLSHPHLPHCRCMFLRNYEVQINISVHESEKKGEQHVLINIELYVPLEHSSPTEDKLHEVVDYGLMRETVARRMAQGHIHLQEMLYDDVLATVLKHPHVLAARVSTGKPDVYPDCGSVGVGVFRIEEQV